VGSYDSHLYAIHEDGTQKWAYNTGGQVNSSPAIGSDGTIYVGSGGSGSEFKLHAVNPDGSGKWTFDCPLAWSSPAIGLDGTIYIGSTDGHLYAIYPDGSLKWKFAAGDFIYASPAIGKDETIYIGANNGRLYAITPAGTQKWVFETGNVNFNSFFSPIIGTDGTIYAGSNYPNNKLYAIHPDGTLNWTFDTGEVYLSTPAISSDGTIYVGSKLKKLFALNPDGTKRWEFETQGFVESSPVIGMDGTIYSGSTDTYFYAIHGAANGPAASSWPMFRNNMLHTGTPDADADGLFDYWERYYFSDLSQHSLGDFDKDGLRNFLEFQMGLNPADSDTDDDGMPDGWEVTQGFDPLDDIDAAQDADEDGIRNLDEYLNGFDPHMVAPEVQFSIEPTSGLAPLVVAFQVVPSGEITLWHWDFGDGGSSNAQNPSHTYLQHGTFTINLSVTGPGGSDDFSVPVTIANPPPVADAGQDQTVDEGTQVLLNGSNSDDPINDIVTYQWTQVSGSPVTLIDDMTVQASFMAPDVGPGGEVLTFQLTVTDSSGLESTDTCAVSVSWINLPPTADTGPNQTVDEGVSVVLSAVNSYDPDDGIETYAWMQVGGKPVALSDQSAVDPFFTAPDVGPNGEALVFQLTITDKNGLEANDTCIVNVTWVNIPPAANAGPDQTVTEGVQVILSGVGSSDSDDGIGAYQWTQISGSTVQLSDAAAVYPTFSAPDVGPDGEALIFQLTVTDTGGLKSTDTCIVNVSWDNVPPVADAGPDQTVTEGLQVILNGFGSSDPDDGIGAYQWTQIAGSPVQLSDPVSVYPTFTAPNVGPDGEALTFQLTVTDGGGLKALDTCIINVSWYNLPPTADAGMDQTVGEGFQVILNGIGSSDPDDGISTYQWTQTAGIPVPLSDNSAAYPTFVAPNVDSDGSALNFQLTVTDRGGLKATDICVINVTWDNVPPVANAGPDQMVSEGIQVVLNGSESSDPDDGISSYGWTQTFGKPVSLVDPAAAYASFTAPDVGPDGELLLFQLTVTDASGLESSDICFVTISWVNQPPTADAGADQSVTEGVLVSLSGSNSYDPDNEIVTYHWRQIDGPAVDVAGANSIQASITAPDVGADGTTLQFELQVNDSDGLSAVDQVFVNVTWSNSLPVANAGPDQSVSSSDLVTLNGSNSYDRDGIAAYSWQQMSGPEVPLSDSSAANPVIIFNGIQSMDASLLFELTVTDTGGLKATDTVIVNVLSGNLSPIADAGLNRKVKPHEQAKLDGMNSRDPDGAIAYYAWKQVAGPTVVLSNPNDVRPTFLAPDVGIGGTALVFELTVADQGGIQNSDTVIVNVTSNNLPPIADAESLLTQTSADMVSLTGTASYDSDGSIVDYRWRQLNGPTAIFSNPSAINPTLSFPDVPSSCFSMEFELTVTDDNGLSDTDTTSVNICDSYAPPMADAGFDLIVKEGNTVSLDASNSYSSEYYPLTHDWKQVAGPQVTLSNAGFAQPTFIAPVVDIYGTELIFQLKVKDHRQLCSVSEVSVFVRDNGLPEMPLGVVSTTTYDGQPVFIQCDERASLVRLEAINPEDIKDEDRRPDNLIFGLMDIQIKVATPGDTTLVTYYLPKPVPGEFCWFKWNESGGWLDYSPHAQFNTPRDMVTITLTDGGNGDDDELVNSMIVDPAGLGVPTSDSNSDSGGGGGGGGCFIRSSADELDTVTLFLQHIRHAANHLFTIWLRFCTVL
jgi:outer membrane protein assembly factor BamB/PKD repeat protein